MAHDLSAMKDKIAKLLAKAERTDNDNEREAFTEAAERLMLKLGIDAAELESAGEVKAEDIVEVRRHYKGVYAATMVSFVSSVANGFGNLQLLQASYKNTRTVYLIGHTSDIEMVQVLLNSVEQQAFSALTAWQKTDPDRPFQSYPERNVGSRSFMLGFGREVGSRLRKLRTEVVEQEASTGAALVLASKQDRVDEWMGAKYGQLKAGRGRSRKHDYSASGAGRSAGAKATLGGKGVGGGSKQLRG